jgi:hypothetical protein
LLLFRGLKCFKLKRNGIGGRPSATLAADKLQGERRKQADG